MAVVRENAFGGVGRTSAGMGVMRCRPTNGQNRLENAIVTAAHTAVIQHCVAVIVHRGKGHCNSGMTDSRTTCTPSKTSLERLGGVPGYADYILDPPVGIAAGLGARLSKVALELSRGHRRDGYGGRMSVRPPPGADPCCREERRTFA